jgi:hypothetical protein
MAVSFDQLMHGFGVVTVMNAKIYEKIGTYTAICANLEGGHEKDEHGNEIHSYSSLQAFNKQDWKPTGEVLDTLKIANITQEGPTKTISGGQYANPLIKYGKTATMEMQDALGRASTLVRFFGCDYVGGEGGRLSVTDKFPGPFATEGETFFIDQKTGEKQWVYIFIPQFIPDAILTLTQDAEGDATVFDLNGSLGVTRITDGGEDTEGREIFYEIRDESFFKDWTEPTAD